MKTGALTSSMPAVVPRVTSTGELKRAVSAWSVREGQQDSQGDRDRLALARRQHQREQLGLVADLGDSDHGGRDKKRFHWRAFAQKERIG
jgi:hypothetical protein